MEDIKKFKDRINKFTFSDFINEEHRLVSMKDTIKILLLREEFIRKFGYLHSV